MPREVAVPDDVYLNYQVVVRELNAAEFMHPDDYPALCLRLMQDLTARLLACDKGTVDQLRRDHGLV